jgi:hypothetical protein
MVNVAGHGADYSRKYCPRLPGYPSNPIDFRPDWVKPITRNQLPLAQKNGQNLAYLPIDFYPWLTQKNRSLSIQMIQLFVPQ